MGIRLARESHNAPSAMNQLYPWLVIFDGDNDCRQTFYSIPQNRYYVRHIPEMENKFIVSSQKGWLVLEDNATDDCSLFNIYTLEKIQFPPLCVYGFHNSVISSNTKIDESCRILISTGNVYKFKSCYLSNSEYREIDYWSRDWAQSINAVLNYEGKLYILSLGCWYLSVADFADRDLHFTPIIEGGKLLNLTLELTDYTKCYLIESSGKILFVYTNRLDLDGLNIKIFEANLDKKEWISVPDLGDRALFLDYYKGLSTSKTASEVGLRSNCVYYVNASKDRNLYIYDMKDGSVTMSLPCPIVSKKNSSLFWAI